MEPKVTHITMATDEMDREVAAREAAGEVGMTRDQAIEALDAVLVREGVSDDQRAAVKVTLESVLPPRTETR